MLRSVFGKTLWEGRRALVWWSLGMLLLAMTALGFYPSIKASAADLQKLIQGLPQGLRHLFLGNAPDFTSPAGYLNGRVFSTIAPILLLVYAVGAGARALAGEERGHTLDLLLSTPLPRRRLALEKLAAMATGLFVLALVLWVALAALGPAFELDVSPGRVAAATFSSYLFALALGAVALAVGGATGSRGSAIGIPTTLAAAGFLLVSLA
ncbi:MAG TPA: ABC transporter permease subunit, partial [Actinomycetota bacterium]|nr:ABC transporter permease subunit [Actinomycetota bacterium]